jgi:hypothetical protein
LQRHLSLFQKIRGIADHGGPTDTHQIDIQDEHRGEALIRCLCRSASDDLARVCARAEDRPLDDSRYTQLLAARARTAEGIDEVNCLSWAASTVQEHKASGMTMASALFCSFEDRTLQAAQVTTASTQLASCP